MRTALPHHLGSHLSIPPNPEITAQRTMLRVCVCCGRCNVSHHLSTASSMALGDVTSSVAPSTAAVSVAASFSFLRARGTFKITSFSRRVTANGHAPTSSMYHDVCSRSEILWSSRWRVPKCTRLPLRLALQSLFVLTRFPVEARPPASFRILTHPEWSLLAALAIHADGVKGYINHAHGKSYGEKSPYSVCGDTRISR